jgi:hypothetical protein
MHNNNVSNARPFVWKLYLTSNEVEGKCIIVFHPLKIYIYIYIQGMDKIMETVDNGGINLFVLAAVKEHNLWILLFFCLFTLCSASVNALQNVFSNSSCEGIAK